MTGFGTTGGGVAVDTGGLSLALLLTAMGMLCIGIGLRGLYCAAQVVWVWAC